MSKRESDLLWLKDMLEHLTFCRGQLEWAEDGETIHLWTEQMVRDLECCRRLCQELNRQASLHHA